MELLAPAGNLEKLKWAVVYGADAVYFGMKTGSLRSFAGNFTFDEAADGLQFLHAHGKKGYVALNVYPFSDECENIAGTARILDDMGADAFIISDMGVLMEAKRLKTKAALHISTQANTTNYQAALAYSQLGAARVNLARELSLERVEKILERTRGSIETEVFIHGAVCLSYSGRCAISNYLTGYNANRGECKHPCRWKYAVMEETRPGQYMPIFEDERGMYIFNNKDLALFEYVPALEKAGVDAIKIEGRMKSVHYIASVVSFYRRILEGESFTRAEGLEILGRVPNRGYSTGFIKGKIDQSDYQLDHSSSYSEAVFVGNVIEERGPDNCLLEVRNKIHAGERLEVLAPDGSITTVTMPDILLTSDGLKVTAANHPQFIFLEHGLKPYTILRRVCSSPQEDVPYDMVNFDPRRESSRRE